MLLEGHRIISYSGSHHDIGFKIGQKNKLTLKRKIKEYIQLVDRVYGIDKSQLDNGLNKWFDNLPLQYREEIKGISSGSNCDLEQVVKWFYCDSCLQNGCTSFIYKHNDQMWIGRNNDYINPYQWGYVTIIKATGKIPTLLFGMEDSLFSSTGYNKEKLWIHYNWLPSESTTLDNTAISPYVFLRYALENAKSINDVQQLLNTVPRSESMNLFIVDGETNDYAVFECSPHQYEKREVSKNFICGANHFCTKLTNESPEVGSYRRQLKLEHQLGQYKMAQLPRDLIAVLADKEVEQLNGDIGTVYSNIACPQTGEMWFAYDGFPAASRGTWKQVDFEW